MSSVIFLKCKTLVAKAAGSKAGVAVGAVRRADPIRRSVGVGVKKKTAGSAAVAAKGAMLAGGTAIALACVRVPPPSPDAHRWAGVPAPVPASYIPAGGYGLDAGGYGGAFPVPVGGYGFPGVIGGGFGVAVPGGLVAVPQVAPGGVASSGEAETGAVAPADAGAVGPAGPAVVPGAVQDVPEPDSILLVVFGLILAAFVVATRRK